MLLSLSLSPFSRWSWVSRYQNVSILDFIGTEDDGSGDDKWSYKLQSRCHLAFLVNKPTPSFFTGRMPFLSPNQQCQSTEGITVQH